MLEKFDLECLCHVEAAKAIEEGVEVNTSQAPMQILHEGEEVLHLPKSVTALFDSSQEVMQSGGRVTGVEFAYSDTVIDEFGNSNVKIDKESTYIAEADNVIIAIGQAPEISFLSSDRQLERALWGSLEVNTNRLSTNIKGIFAGGDFTTGPSTVIKAIASGRRAAIAIDKYLQGETGRITILDEKSEISDDIKPELEEEAEKERPRLQLESENSAERVKDFREVEIGFSENEAQLEAKRCLRCDLDKEEM